MELFRSFMEFKTLLLNNRDPSDCQFEMIRPFLVDVCPFMLHTDLNKSQFGNCGNKDIYTTEGKRGKQWEYNRDAKYVIC